MWKKFHFSYLKFHIQLLTLVIYCFFLFGIDPVASHLLWCSCFRRHNCLGELSIEQKRVENYTADLIRIECDEQLQSKKKAFRLKWMQREVETLPLTMIAIVWMWQVHQNVNTKAEKEEENEQRKRTHHTIEFAISNETIVRPRHHESTNDSSDRDSFDCNNSMKCCCLALLAVKKKRCKCVVDTFQPRMSKPEIVRLSNQMKMSVSMFGRIIELYEIIGSIPSNFVTDKIEKMFERLGMEFEMISTWILKRFQAKNVNTIIGKRWIPKRRE